MHASLILGSLILPFALAAPTAHGLRSLKPLWPRQDNNTCNLAEVPQPTNTLTPPTADMELVLIALGRGTQNYTCANATAAPAAIGAVANLFNASCAVANNSPLGQIAEDEAAIGAHFFFDNTTPEFDIIGLGETLTKKVEEVAAPQPANIKWLRLEAQQTTTGPVRQIYRLNTVGGLAPASCEGQESGNVVTVEYEAQYWIYACKESLAAARAQRRAAMAFKGP